MSTSVSQNNQGSYNPFQDILNELAKVKTELAIIKQEIETIRLDDDGDVINAQQLAKWRKCSMAKIYADTSLQRIPFMKDGKKLLFSKKQLLSFWENSRKLVTVFIFLALSQFAKSQGVSYGYLRYDSLKIEKTGGNAELILLNGSRDSTGAFLFNKGNGRTEFRRALKKINDSTYLVGLDTLKLKGSTGGGGTWGSITGSLSSQTDLQTALDLKGNLSSDNSWSGANDFATILQGGLAVLTGNQTITLNGDITGSGATAITTTIANGAITNAKFRNSLATSVVGRSANSTGAVADIQATSDGQFLVRRSGAILFGGITAADIPDLSANYIQNQTASTQSGSFNINHGTFNALDALSSSYTIRAKTNTAADFFTVRNDRNIGVNGTFNYSDPTGTSTLSLAQNAFVLNSNSNASTITMNGSGMTLGGFAVSIIPATTMSKLAISTSTTLPAGGSNYLNVGSTMAIMASSSGAYGFLGVGGTMNSGTYTSITGSSNIYGARITTNFGTPNTNITSVKTLQLQPTFNQTASSSGDFLGIDYDPIVTSITGTHYGLLIRPQATKNGFGTATPTALLDINGSTGYNQFRLRTQYTPTSSADSNGNTGDVAVDDNYIYYKTSAGWKRATLSIF